MSTADMTFEEFFKKKKIDLEALARAEPDLYAEFRSHYGQMGEKSFDHTKKFWFNQLRLRYHLAAETKAEKVTMENKAAEQTVADTLTEPPPAKSAGFRPRFKAGSTVPPVPVADTPSPGPSPAARDEAEETPRGAAATPGGFRPTFRRPAVSSGASAANDGEKPVSGSATGNPAPAQAQPAQSPASDEADKEAGAPAKSTYKPRFNAARIKPKDES